MLKFYFASIISVRSTSLWEKGRIRIRIHTSDTNGSGSGRAQIHGTEWLISPPVCAVSREVLPSDPPDAARQIHRDAGEVLLQLEEDAHAHEPDGPAGAQAAGCPRGGEVRRGGRALRGGGRGGGGQGGERYFPRWELRFMYFFLSVLRIRRIRMFLGLLDPDPDPLVWGINPDPDTDHSIIKQK